MALWTLWPGDDVPALTPLAGFDAADTMHVAGLVALTGLDADEIAARLDAGNRCYVARLDGAPVAYGWVATGAADIGELDVAFHLDGADRYLWDFQTLPAWRGRGVYPHLLQAILHAEGRGAARYWIITAPENVASARGIARAGFRCVADLAFAADGRAGLVPRGEATYGQVGAALLGVPVITPPDGPGVSPCWGCVMDAVRQGLGAACWPMAALDTAACACGCAQPAGVATRDTVMSAA